MRTAEEALKGWRRASKLVQETRGAIFTEEDNTTPAAQEVIYCAGQEEISLENLIPDPVEREILKADARIN